jgi:hypothetical protein
MTPKDATRQRKERTVKKISIALAGLGLTALGLCTAPGVAQATPSTSSSSGSTPAAAADGYLYAWDGFNRTGAWCRWYNNDDNWETCSGSASNLNMRNKASSLENRGYAGSLEDVDLFIHPAYKGTHNCLPNGYYLNNLTGIYFLWDGKDGQGQTTNNNIASHRWSNNC